MFIDAATNEESLETLVQKRGFFHGGFPRFLLFGYKIRCNRKEPSLYPRLTFYNGQVDLGRKGQCLPSLCPNEFPIDNQNLCITWPFGCPK